MSTIQQALADAQSQLSRLPDVPSKLESEILLAFTMQTNRTYLYTWPEKLLGSRQIKQFQSLLERRMTGEPIAYITGQREFWGLPLKVSPATLIPRPETERLVEIALERIPKNVTWRIADLGTGSGALALAIAGERPRCQIIASDICKEALAVAEQNRVALQLTNVRFIHGHWFEALSGERFNMVLSNPPYVAENDPHLSNGDLRFEPTQALSSGPDGLNAIREILADANQHLISGAWLILEHGYNQGDEVYHLFQQHGFDPVITYPDYAKRERATAGQYLIAERG